MTKEQVVQGYLMNSPKVVAEMLYETIEKYENRSCDNCKNAYYQDVTNDLDDDVYSCDEFESSFININDSGRPKDFSCKKWQSK